MSYDDLLYNASNEVQSGQLSREDYAAKKKAEREGIFALADTTALNVAGDSDKLRQYLDVQSTFDRYGMVNALLIMAQNPEATRLGDFEHWKEKGGFVKPGQTGISILEPQEYAKEDGSTGVGYNIKKVFDISQIDARKMKTNPPPCFDERQLLKALLHKAPVQVIAVDIAPPYLPENYGALYDQKDNHIIVRKGMKFADIFRSVAQELAFAGMYNSQDTPADTRFSAYCAAYLLCKKYGVDTQVFNFDNAPAVLEGMEAQTVKGELLQIRDAAFDSAGRMAKMLKSVQKAARTAQEAR
jgi:hypothetical protein